LLTKGAESKGEMNYLGFQHFVRIVRKFIGRSQTRRAESKGGRELSWTWDVYIRCFGAPFAKDTSNDG